MENIPQPAEEPYAEGDRVRIYLGTDDMDVGHHGRVCEVLDDHPDDLGVGTGREIDSDHYRLRDVDEDTVLSVRFRHADLVSASEWPNRD